MGRTKRWNAVILTSGLALAVGAASCGGGGGSSNQPPPAISVSVSPSSASVNLSATEQFTASVQNATNTAVTWSISPSGVGSIDQTGKYTAPDDLPASTSVTIKALSQQDNSTSGTATVTVTSNEAVTVSPGNVNLKAGQQQQFSATVTGSSKDQGVNWSAASGTITSSGSYTAPASGTDTVTATSKADGSKKGTAAVTVVSISAVSPATQTVDLSQTQQFNATVTGPTDTTVVWSILPTTGAGTISAGGLYTAPNDVPASTSVTVTATSHANSSVSSSTTLTLASNESVGAVAPANPTVNAGAQQQFTGAAVSGSSTDKTVTWSAVSGTITSGGLYTAPVTVPASGKDTVTAKSNADPSKSASTTVTISTPVSISAVSPATPTVDLSQTQQFNATVTGSADTAVVWSISPTTGAGTISAGGLYTAPNDLPASNHVTVTATSHADSSVSSNTTLTIASNESIGAISPANPTVNTGAQQQFTGAAVSGSSTDKTVTWSAVSGTITSGGLYTAPATVPASGKDTVTAKSNADPSQSASTTVTITSNVTVAVNPPAATVATSGAVQFSATVTGSTNTGVSWKAVSGTITQQGLYTAPATLPPGGTDTVAATSNADNSKQAKVTVTVQAQNTTLCPSSAPCYLTPLIVAVQNSGGFNLTVNGSVFASGNTVLFNGVAKPTNFVNAQQLTAAIASSDVALNGTFQVTIQAANNSVTPPLNFYVVPSLAPQEVAVTAGSSVSGANINLNALTPTLQLLEVGTCTGGNCSASTVGGTASQNSQAQLFVIGNGVVPGTYFVVDGSSGEITVTQPLASDFGVAGGMPSVNFSISISKTATVGPRSILVVNPAGEISVFPGGLEITP